MNSGDSRYTLVNVYSLRTGKSPFLQGKSTINGHFQWLFVYHRVPISTNASSSLLWHLMLDEVCQSTALHR